MVIEHIRTLVLENLSNCYVLQFCIIQLLVLLNARALRHQVQEADPP